MEFIQNGIVQMDWDASMFYEARVYGEDGEALEETSFVAALNVYDTPKGNVTVVFKDRVAFLLIDPDTGAPAEPDDIGEAIKECYAEGSILEEVYEESYVPLEGEDIALVYGLSSEQYGDIEDRLFDLSGYWYEIVEDMG